MKQAFEQALEALPALLQPTLEAHWQAYVEACQDAALPLSRHPEFLSTLARVWASSEFVALTCVREPGLLADLLASGDLLADYARGEYLSKVRAATAECNDVTQLGSALRALRRREMLRIAWRDLAGWLPVEAVLSDLSALADACIEVALQCLQRWHFREYGAPKTEQGQRQDLIVLAMGKLGARELNFSSDIDLIFAYPEPGQLKGRGGLSYEELFTRLAQDLIRVLNEQTAEGFVYRVDMRLRPFGDAGPLVMSFSALEDYYQSQGREWERYALIKARAITGTTAAVDELEALLRPFIYRRYLDFGAFEQLREMKAMIRAEVERRGLQQDIKLGPGGIREIEFIAQAFQLIRGGREPQLRERRLLRVLDRLCTLRLLPEFAARRLADAYRFLRRVENRLQAYADQQQHQLPSDTPGQARLAYSMGYPDWSAFMQALEVQRRFVQGQFEQVFSATQSGSGENAEPVDFELLWQGRLEPERAHMSLAAAGADQPDEILRLLEALRDSSALHALGNRGRARLDRLMPLLLGAVCETPAAASSFARVAKVIEAIAGRSAYLALLVEHPMALSQLVHLCAASPWIAEQLRSHPLLLDELLDPRQLYQPLRRDDLQAQLQARMATIDPQDLEQQMDSLRQFRQMAVIRVAAADVMGVTPLMVVSDALTEIAEVILNQVLALCWVHLTARYGVPRCRLQGRAYEPGFVILAYGKLGGIELSYGSDLDLVFIHDSGGDNQFTDGPKKIDNSIFYARLGQRIIHVLNTLTPAGILYEVDTRLRPSGSAGLLVTSLEAFTDYQRNEAWTWEQQALVRARVVAGNTHLAAAIAAVRKEVLGRQREPHDLRQAVVAMRQRMRAELDSRDPDRFDLKQGAGGIADIEFMVQYLVLRYAHEHPKLLVWSDNIRLLETLEAVGRLPPEAASQLADAYRRYRARLHQLTLQELPGQVPAEEFEILRAQVTGWWRHIMEIS